MPIPKNFVALEQPSSKEIAFRQILEWIIDGTFAPGEKINDMELSKVLGISRTPVREALQMLEAQNFVEIMPGRKTIVTNIDEDEIKLILPPISALSAVACELAIDKISDQSIDELMSLNKQIERNIYNKNFLAAGQYDLEFHDIILKIANNKYVDGMLSMMLAHIRRLMYSQRINISLNSVEEHNQLIKAFKMKDKALVIKYSTINWNRPLNEYFKL
ncbi:MAG: transcriptional regulator [Firmicutes bacterium]|nr:transcriptional regulator [Bacillota bacterium]